MKIRVHIFLSGRVQGVFFRLTTKEWADELGVKGWVRNLHDGRVEAVIEGEEEKVREMLDLMKKGPSFALVENMEIQIEDFKNEFKDFRIRYY